MESRFAKFENNISQSIHLVPGLPELRLLARSNVDIYLPSTNENWKDSSVQEPFDKLEITAYDRESLDATTPPYGMLNPVDTSFNPSMQNEDDFRLSSGKTPQKQKSNSRQTLMTIAILALAAGVSWAYFYPDALDSAIVLLKERINR